MVGGVFPRDTSVPPGALFGAVARRSLLAGVAYRRLSRRAYVGSPHSDTNELESVEGVTRGIRTIAASQRLFFDTSPPAGFCRATKLLRGNRCQSSGLRARVIRRLLSSTRRLPKSNLLMR